MGCEQRHNPNQSKKQSSNTRGWTEPTKKDSNTYLETGTPKRLEGFESLRTTWWPSKGLCKFEETFETVGWELPRVKERGWRRRLSLISLRSPLRAIHSFFVVRVHRTCRKQISAKLRNADIWIFRLKQAKNVIEWWNKDKKYRKQINTSDADHWIMKCTFTSDKGKPFFHPSRLEKRCNWLLYLTGNETFAKHKTHLWSVCTWRHESHIAIAK